LLLLAEIREWLPEDDLVYVILDAVGTLDLGGFCRSYRAGGHGRAAFDPEMMVALLLYGYCQGERSSRVIEKQCVRDVAYRVITGGVRPGHATIARFRARHEQALGGLFSQVLRLLAAEGMVSLGTLSLDGTKLAGNAAHKASKTLPQIGKILAEAAERDAAEDARYGDAPGEPAPRALAARAGRRERLAAARDRLRLRTRCAVTRSGPSSRPGRRPRRPGSGAGTAPGMSHAPTGPAPGRGRTPPAPACG
jgi:transposase